MYTAKNVYIYIVVNIQLYIYIYIVRYIMWSDAHDTISQDLMAQPEHHFILGSSSHLAGLISLAFSDWWSNMVPSQVPSQIISKSFVQDMSIVKIINIVLILLLLRRSLKFIKQIACNLNLFFQMFIYPPVFKHGLLKNLPIYG